MGFKKTLIFILSLEGHRLEYVHHVYEEARNRPNEEFVFVVPELFKTLKNHFSWIECTHIHFILLPEEDIYPILNAKGRLKRSKKCVQLLKKYVRQERPTHILLIMLMSYMPFLALRRWEGSKISGIIYRIYLYEKQNLIQVFFNSVFYSLLSKRRCFQNLFILNDSNGAKRLNGIYNTSKFCYLPDPVPAINMKEVKCIREQIGVKPSEKIFFHFGGLSERKGTLVILEAISLMKPEDLKNKVFVFAGVVNDDIKERFYTQKETLEKKARIVVYDKFCPYSLINDLCYSCDILLVPYENTSQSSGVIGYASYFKKPIIGPSRGLLGNIIREYNMGMTLDYINADCMKEAIEAEPQSYSCNYYTTHTISDFMSVLLS